MKKLLLFLVFLLCLISAQSTFAQTSVTQLIMNSERGDSVGLGGHYNFSESDGQWTVTPVDRTGDGKVDGISLKFVSLQNIGWSLTFSTDKLGQNLALGFYDKAERAVFASMGHPGLDVGGDGRGCDTITGNFTILDLNIDYSGKTPKVISFAAQFQQICCCRTSLLFGSNFYHSSVPSFSLAIDPNNQLFTAAGTSVDCKINLFPINNFSESPKLSAEVVPNDGNVSISFSSDQITPSNNEVLTIKTAPDTLPQIYHLLLKGTSGQLASYATAIFTIPYGPDFSIEGIPSSVSLKLEGSVDTQVAIKRTGGFTGKVTIMPTNAKMLKIKVSALPQTDNNSRQIFKIKTSSKTPQGLQSLIFSGKDEMGHSHTMTVTLAIYKP